MIQGEIATLLITTLFNLFSPLFDWVQLESSIAIMVTLFLGIGLLWIGWVSFVGSNLINGLSSVLYPTSNNFNSVMLVSMFLVLSVLNLFSLVVYSFPVTTTLGFNLSLSLSAWIASILSFFLKSKYSATVLPKDSPWYLIPFLSVVELVSLVVRPVTLSFRLLANMSAGHVLLTLISKVPKGWVLGSLFGGLELMVSLVQAFVLTMLVMVYLEESETH